MGPKRVIVVTTIFHGTTEEVADLKQAIARNCTCDPEHGKRCAVCTAALYDQEWLNRLLFIRRIRVQLWREESMKGEPRG